MQKDKWRVMDNNFEYLNDILVRSDYIAVKAVMKPTHS